MTTYCGTCGAALTSDATFCGSCGAAAEPTVPDELAPAPAPAQGRPWRLIGLAALVVVAFAGAAFALLAHGGGHAAASTTTVVRQFVRTVPVVTTVSAPTTTEPALTTAATVSAPALALVYVRRVDALLGESHSVVVALRSFVPRASSGAVGTEEAIRLAGSYLAKRQEQLAQANALAPPPSLQPAHRLLLAALSASVADDEALVEWTIDRRSGGGGAQAALDRATQLGIRASAAKALFLRNYARERLAATGRPSSSLPKVF